MKTKSNKPKKNKFKERQEAREEAMAFIYSIDYHLDEIAFQIENFMSEENIVGFSDESKKYINDVISGVVDKLKEIDPLIEKYSRGWSFNRIPNIDIAVLRLCIYEMIFREDIPASVSINEAVNLAKKYGHDESGTFVNGILGSIYKEAVASGKINEDKPKRK